MRLFPEESPPLPTTRRVLSVSEATRDLKDLIEDNFPSVWLRGEVSNFRPYTSGHFYFTIKDAGAQIAAVMFKGHNARLKFRLEDGMAIVAHGRLSVYEPRGNYQILVDHLEPDGVGALQIAFEQLKKKLAAEGLFDAARKRPLPFLPHTVGIVTSPDGAALHDLLSVLRRRFPNVNILLYPVKVQGEGAANDIAAGVNWFASTRAADVVIVGRGGGSIEDLWAFNEECVARAVAVCPVPVISAVGHETDFTICDFVSDVRAPTPSAAAELSVPRKSDLLAAIAAQKRRLQKAITDNLASLARSTAHLKARVPSPVAIHDRWRLRLSDLEDRLERGMIFLIREHRRTITESKLALADPRHLLRDAERCLTQTRTNLIHVWEKFALTQSHGLARQRLKLELLSPRHALKRGYVLARRADGSLLARKAQSQQGERATLVFYDGEVNVEIIS